VTRTHDNATGCSGVGFDLGTSERFTIVRAAILERVQTALEANDGDVIAIQLGIEPLTARDCGGIADIDPARGFVHIMPVCKRAASDIID
jgi:hypothetical protein